MGITGLAVWVEWAIVIAAVVSIGLVVAEAMGRRPPDWFRKVGWILVAAIVGILAIKFLIGAL